MFIIAEEKQNKVAGKENATKNLNRDGEDDEGENVVPPEEEIFDDELYVNPIFHSYCETIMSQLNSLEMSSIVLMMETKVKEETGQIMTKSLHNFLGGMK